jgi:hypothetical protein
MTGGSIMGEGKKIVAEIDVYLGGALPAFVDLFGSERVLSPEPQGL